MNKHTHPIWIKLYCNNGWVIGGGGGGKGKGGLPYFPDPVLVPARRDMTVLFPTPCLPTTPTTRKSLCSSMYWKIRRTEDRGGQREGEREREGEGEGGRER